MFKAAVYVFWVSFFANIRGTSSRLRSALFAQVVSTATGKPHEWLKENYTSCVDIWHKIHNAMLTVFAENIVDLSETWLTTEAGEYFRDQIKRARYPLK
jgi:hypothetical protein